MNEKSDGISRRRLLEMCSAAGVCQTLLPGVLWGMVTHATTQAQSISPATVDHDHLASITPEMIDAAAALAAVHLTDAQKKQLIESLRQQRDSVLAIRTMKIPNSVPPAFVFDPVPAGMKLDAERHPLRLSRISKIDVLLSGEDALAFATVREQAELLKTRKITSTALTRLYLDRLKKYDPRLHFVITHTEDRALQQASEADREIAAGRYKGPLHGIPWGAKDLLAVKGYPTTWGAAGFEQQSFDYDATIVQRLDAAGAVLAAKLTMGALAQGDLWFGGRTRNPWNTKQGSSGSSAGSASAVSAGCVAFAIGTETLGSISSPSTRCGTTGLRPTFGFVPRTGAMTLSWTMDKIGPICRSVEDCALVMSAIYGPDGNDRSVKNAAFNWDADFDWKNLRIGYIEADFEAPILPPNPNEQQKLDFARDIYDARYEQAALVALKKMGINLIKVTLPKGYHFGDQSRLLGAEAAAAFEELTLSGRDALLNGQEDFDWPNSFRRARFYSAVDYIQAQRARMLTIDAFEKIFETVDIIVTPSDGAQLSATNLTGHPAVIVPNGVRGDDAPLPEHTGDGDRKNTGGPGTPVSLTFLGGLYADARLAAFARAYQEATGFHRLHPKFD